LVSGKASLKFEARKARIFPRTQGWWRPSSRSIRAMALWASPTLGLRSSILRPSFLRRWRRRWPSVALAGSGRSE